MCRSIARSPCNYPRNRSYLKAEIAKYEEEQGVEERQRVAIIRDLHERAEAQRAANEAWAEKVEESQSVADGLAKKVCELKRETPGRIPRSECIAIDVCS